MTFEGIKYDYLVIYFNEKPAHLMDDRMTFNGGNWSAEIDGNYLKIKDDASCVVFNMNDINRLSFGYDDK